MSKPILGLSSVRRFALSAEVARAPPLYTPGAAVRRVGDPPIMRPRGDRRGLEPAAGELDPEGRAIRWRGRDGAGGRWAVWSGDPVESLSVDLKHGGLGDRLRTAALAVAAVRCGRVRHLVPEYRPGHVFPLAVGVDGRVSREPAARLIDCVSFAWPTMMHWKEYGRREPLLSMCCAALGLPFDALAGPVLAVDPVRLAALRAAWAPWEGPRIAVQCDVYRAPDGPTSDDDEAVIAWEGLVARDRKMRSLHDVARCLADAGALPVAVGSARAPGEAELPGHDLRGCDLATLTAALFGVDLVVALDSGPMHLAGVLGTPCLAVFGPSDPIVHVTGAGTLPVSRYEACPAVAPCGAGSIQAGPHRPKPDGSRWEDARPPCTGTADYAACVRSIGAEELAALALDVVADLA